MSPDQLAAALGTGVLRLLGEGQDHRTFEVEGAALVVRQALDGKELHGEELHGEDLHREAALLRTVAGLVPVAVPEPVEVRPDLGCLVLTRVPGVPLLDLPVATQQAAARDVAAVLGDLLARVQATPPGTVEDLIEVDDFPPEAWREEARETVDALRPHLSREQARQAEAFLAAPLPAAASRLVLSHNDLGIEHVLVQRDTTAAGSVTVTGVVDWSDTALTDPAHDLGLLLRDLDRPALEAALEAYRRAGGSTPADLSARILLHARCGLLEDLRYGLETGRTAYAEKSRRAWPAVFAAGTT